MAADFTIKRGDQLPKLRATLKDSLNVTPNLTASTVKFIMTDKATSALILANPADIIDATGGIVEYAWLDGDTDIASTYNGEFEVLYGDGKAETFPNSKHIQIKVFADLGGAE